MAFIFNCWPVKISRAAAKKGMKDSPGQEFTSYSDAPSDCDLDSLYDRREEHDCLRFAEGLSNSSRTNDLLLPVRREVHGRNISNADN